jgi:hypothetical protein
VSLPVPNQPVEVEGTIDDFDVLELSTAYTVLDDVESLFMDPDGDELTYSLEYDNSVFQLDIANNELTLIATSDYSGSKSVVIKASDGEYEASITFNVSLTLTSIDELNQVNYSISCYPNPFKDIITVQLLDLANISMLHFSIYNLSGKQIIDESIEVSGSNLDVSFNLNGFPMGVYMLHVRDNNGKSSLIRLNKK